LPDQPTITGNVRGQSGRQLSFDCLCRHGAASLVRIIAGREFPAKPGPQQLPGPSGSSSGIYGPQARGF
jgi:hypothetical protein